MTPISHSGNRETRNLITGVASALVVTSNELKNTNLTLNSGSLIYNNDTGQLKIANGKDPLQSLPDHQHPLYSPVFHSHITSANEVWRVSEPRLWYTDDLVNHPELVPLDGREIANDQAKYLSRVYPGSTLLTQPCERMDQDGFQNTTMTLKVDDFQGNFVGGTITGEAIDTENMLIYTDQWLTNTTDVNKTHTVTIEFKNGHTYSPNEYWIIPAAGISTAPLKERPTPNTWTLQGSVDHGESWETLDEQTGIDNSQWRAMHINTYPVPVVANAYTTIRLVISKWNAIEGDPLEPGLRRFWIFGNKEGVFTLPKVESPDPSFSWVVPYHDLDVGLRHEAIGDIGLTTVLPEYLPRYRLPATGGSYFRESYPELFNRMGFTQDHAGIIENISATSGSVLEENSWEDIITDIHDVKVVEITPSWADNETIGAYYIGQLESNVPLAWLVEGQLESGEYESIQTITNTTSEDMANQEYKFYIDSTITDKKYTKIRFTFTEWFTDNAKAKIKFELFTHPIDEFYLPNITISGTENCYAYIVANNTAVDTSSEVIASLQRNQAELLQLVASLQEQINAQDTRLNSLNVPNT